MLQGRGAGDMPTASAICGDIVSAASGDRPVYPSFRNTPEDDPSFEFTNDWVTRYYIRLSALDQAGVLTRLASCFSEENVSIASMMQKTAAKDGMVQLVFITHPASEQAVRRAIGRMDEEICRLEQVIRVEVTVSFGGDGIAVEVKNDGRPPEE